MTKREMGNYFGFGLGLGLCSYVLFWFVLEKAENRGRERAEHRDLEDCYYVIFFFFLMLRGNLWSFKNSVLYIYIYILIIILRFLI